MFSCWAVLTSALRLESDKHGKQRQNGESYVPSATCLAVKRLFDVTGHAQHLGIYGFILAVLDPSSLQTDGWCGLGDRVYVKQKRKYQAVPPRPHLGGSQNGTAQLAQI